MGCRLEGITPEDGEVFCNECQKTVSYKIKEHLDEIDSKPLTPEETAWATHTEQDIQKDVIIQMMHLDISVVCGRNKQLVKRLKKANVNTLENITKKSPKYLTDLGIKTGEVGHITRKLKEFGLSLRTI